MVSFTVPPALRYAQANPTPGNLTPETSNSASTISATDQVHFGANRRPTGADVSRAENAIQALSPEQVLETLVAIQNGLFPATPEGTAARQGEIKKALAIQNDPERMKALRTALGISTLGISKGEQDALVTRYIIMTQVISPGFLQTEEGKKFFPQMTGNTMESSSHYLERIFGKTWEKYEDSATLAAMNITDVAGRTLLLRGLLQRNPYPYDIGVVGQEPVRLYTRAEILDKFFSDRTKWSDSAFFLLGMTYPSLSQKAANLSKEFEQEFGKTNGEDWKDYPKLLIPAEKTVSQNMFLLRYFRYPTKDRFAYYELLTRSTNFLEKKLREALNVPDEVPMPASPNTQQQFEAYMKQKNHRKFELVSAGRLNIRQILSVSTPN